MSGTYPRGRPAPVSVGGLALLLWQRPVSLGALSSRRCRSRWRESRATWMRTRLLPRPGGVHVLGGHRSRNPRCLLPISRESVRRTALRAAGPGATRHGACDRYAGAELRDRGSGEPEPASLLGSGHRNDDREKPVYLQGRRTPGLEIGDDVRIGTNSVVLPGVEIRRGAIIGAGTVLTGDVPEFAVVVGNPGRVIGYHGREPPGGALRPPGPPETRGTSLLLSSSAQSGLSPAGSPAR